jgi:serine/threonine-protein kinase
MVLRDGGVKLLDSGILGSDELARRCSRAARATSACRTRRPSGCWGRRERRSDLFSLGVVLWESLIGRSLFRARTPSKTLANVLRRVIPPPSHFRAEISSALDRVVLRALERDPEQRPASAEALANELEALLDADPRPSLASLMEELAAGGRAPSVAAAVAGGPGRLWCAILPDQSLARRRCRAARRVPRLPRVSPAVALAGLALTAGARWRSAGICWRAPRPRPWRQPGPCRAGLRTRGRVRGP